MNTNHLLIFTRTPLHVGSGSSVGAIDMPVQRDQHTQFPIIPGSGLKGVFADAWNADLNEQGKRPNDSDVAWLFGSEDDQAAAAGALLFGEARILAFPVRSLVNCFAWITCPLILKRAVRDGIIGSSDFIKDLSLEDEKALAADKGMTNSGKTILEEYSFETPVSEPLHALAEELGSLFNDDVWKTVKERLIVVSDGIMSYFCKAACEVQQRVKIDDNTGVVAKGALFNQENVPAETLFYSVLHSTNERKKGGGQRNAAEAVEKFGQKLKDEKHTFQFGGDAGIGLGFCTVNLK